MTPARLEPGHPGQHRTASPGSQTDIRPETGQRTISNRTPSP